MKILIVTESMAGKGHYKAAESIAKSIESSKISHEVKIVNLLPIVSKNLEQIVKVIYMTILKKIPKLWGWMHQRESKFALYFKKIIAYIMIIRLKRFIEIEKPELIIATHASGLTALSMLKTKNKYRLAAVFTDYQVNSFWVDKNIDYYFVAHQEFKTKLIEEYQVNPSKVFVSGIPIDPIFFYSTKRSKIFLADLKKKFRILIMGGGFGLGSIKEIICSLNLVKDVPISITVVTGMNQQLFRELSLLKSTLNVPLKVLKYQEDVFTLMKNNDLLISKAGGLTISEALSVPIPILIYRPLPGQEEKNSKFLIKMKSVIRISRLEDIQYWTKYLYYHPNFYLKLIQQEQKIAKPDSAIYISNILLNQNKKI
ncbi:hypothetical protein BHF71_08255 [Vulcanibacillus modesticaldus]|uniref:Galactosyldiacylglycerol synthase n=1 Tax=Vulcanibacillus modesticaldus TaxID=337097 RepID=A0A1D2YVF7_9BACI|nr:glycosyltransferase [Vulcanibacillus modesticaldus]OEF99605.1 hypothetical protein BHF71_08255 [Vulcanibacillus modesticaldus]